MFIQKCLRWLCSFQFLRPKSCRSSSHISNRVFAYFLIFAVLFRSIFLCLFNRFPVSRHRRQQHSRQRFALSERRQKSLTIPQRSLSFQSCSESWVSFRNSIKILLKANHLKLCPNQGSGFFRLSSRFQYLCTVFLNLTLFFFFFSLKQLLCYLSLVYYFWTTPMFTMSELSFLYPRSSENDTFGIIPWILISRQCCHMLTSSE